MLQIIQDNNLYGLANSFNQEVVECIYDQIKPLKNGLFKVIKDKMAGLLDENGKILLYLQPCRLFYLKEIDVFKYNVDEKWLYFRYIDNKICYLDAERLNFDKSTKIIHIFKGGKFFLYDVKSKPLYDLSSKPIQIYFDTIILTNFTQGHSRFYLGTQNNRWGVFRIKFIPGNKYGLCVEITPQYNTAEESLQALKEIRKERRRKKKASIKKALKKRNMKRCLVNNASDTINN